MSSLTYTGEHLAWKQRVGHEYQGVQKSQSQNTLEHFFSTRFSQDTLKKPQFEFRAVTRGTRFRDDAKFKLQEKHTNYDTRFLYEDGGKDCRGRYSRKAVAIPAFRRWGTNLKTAENPSVRVVRKLNYEGKPDVIAPQMKRSKSSNTFSRRYTTELEEQIRRERNRRLNIEAKIRKIN